MPRLFFGLIGTMQATPPYLTRHSGPCVIAGSAWCLEDDVARAKAIYGDIPVIAVNGAARFLKAFLLVSQHPERFKDLGWIEKQRGLFGSGFTVHSCGDPRNQGVDHWWPIRKRGGSAWLARKIACFIGFRPIILCGCPMEPGPYADNSNIGGFMHDKDVVNELMRQIETDEEWHDGCYSMSGRTAKLLGEPCLQSAAS